MFLQTSPLLTGLPQVFSGSACGHVLRLRTESYLVLLHQETPAQNWETAEEYDC